LTRPFPQRERLTPHSVRLAPATPLAAHVLTVLVAVTAAAPFRMSGPVIFALSSLSLFYVALSGRVTLPHWTIVAFVGWCAVTVSWSIVPAESINGVLILAVSSLALWCLVHQLDREAVYRALATAVKVLLVGSLLVYILFPVSGREQTADHFGALRGLFIQRNSAAFVLAAGLLLFVYLAASPSFRHRKRWAAWALFALAMLLATESSTGLAVGVVSCAVLLFLVRLRTWARSVRQLFAVLLLSVTAVAVVGTLQDLAWVSRLLGRDTTLTGRTFIWSLLEPYIRAEPWTGYGWAAVWTPESLMARAMWGVARFRFPHAHNAYLDALAQVGAAGLVLLLLVCVTILAVAGRRVVTGTGDVWAVWPFAVTFFLLLYGISENSFMSYFGWDLLVIALALLAAHGATSGDDGHGAEPSTARPAAGGTTVRSGGPR
jgi:O-antigen ligase